MKALESEASHPLWEPYRCARETWPGIEVSFDAFERRVSASERAKRVPAARLVLNDLYLACAIEGGDTAAWELVYVRYRDWLFHVARRYTQNDAVAEDIADEIIAEIRKRIEGYSGTGSLEGWFRAVVSGLVRDYYRRTKREVSLDGLLESKEEGGINSAVEARILSDREQGARGITGPFDIERCVEILVPLSRRTIESLKPQWRDLIYYKYSRGMTSREIAKAVFRVGEDVVAKWLKKAIDRMEKRARILARDLYRSTTEELRYCVDLVMGRMPLAAQEAPNGDPMREQGKQR